MRRVFSRASQNENVGALRGDGGKNKYLLKAPQDDNISLALLLGKFLKMSDRLLAGKFG
ncbi:MAG: hypothetical protein F6K24_39385 [Okeania sp. SIO2D1]|nr:hypothetical protein [Okeania sp. SIO2D1]